MKSSVFFLLLFLYNISFCKELDSLLVVVLMVKNEEHVMQKTLQPFLDAGVDSYLILDTGSTDDTVSITKKLFEDYNVEHGYVAEEEFIDFATSRNYAIEQAEKKFPRAKFILMIDAEWYIHNVDFLLDFCREHIVDQIPSYLLTMYANSAKSLFYQQRLFKAHQGIKFEGVVHEALNVCQRINVPSDVYFIWNPSQQGINKSQKRWLRDRDLLLQEQKKHPNDPRTLFYLAQTYDCLNECCEALFWYKKRCNVNGWVQETFMAYYRLANIYERLKDWDNAVLSYLKAFSLCPSRVEPLVKLAEYYWTIQEFELSYMFALRSVQKKLLDSDALFIEKEMYDYTRYEVLGRVAWYVGEYEIGKWALIQALQIHPDEAHLINNLSYYLVSK